METSNKQDTSNNNNSDKITGIDNQVADPTNNANNVNNGIQAYSNTMGGYSDNFSFLDNDNPMEHSFSFLNGNSSQITTPTEDFNSNNKIKTQTDINYDKLVEQRNSETPQKQKII